jgi:hypothetical protein
MRKLNGGDVFVALRALRAVDLKETVAAFTERAEVAKTENEKKAANAALFEALIKNVTDEKTEDLVFTFLAGPFEKENAEAVRAMDLDELGECLEKLGEENDLKLFFGRVKRMIRPRS